jgi:hypothetical protein
VLVCGFVGHSFRSNLLLVLFLFRQSPYNFCEFSSFEKGNKNFFLYSFYHPKMIEQHQQNEEDDIADDFVHVEPPDVVATAVDFPDNENANYSIEQLPLKMLSLEVSNIGIISNF